MNWRDYSRIEVNEYIYCIARYDVATAEKWALGIIEKTDLLVEQPESGRIVPEYGDPKLRELIVGSYRLIYRIRKEENTGSILSHSCPKRFKIWEIPIRAAV